MVISSNRLPQHENSGAEITVLIVTVHRNKEALDSKLYTNSRQDKMILRAVTVCYPTYYSLFHTTSGTFHHLTELNHGWLRPWRPAFSPATLTE
ncbi:hypothetical protein TNCV_4176721 [Trichonephila clavipes]|nr:hypothetical protein TNCV_4176721 [Trichonephila clavipes]